MSAAMEQQTYLPDSDGDLARIASFVEAHRSKHGNGPETQYFLSGAGEHDQVVIPADVYRALRQVVEALAAGKAVTVAPQDKLLTTQQAADLIGVSRPTVVKLIDEGEIPGHTPAKRRRLVRLEDVLAYRARRREAQYRAIFATSADHDDDEPAELTAERLRRVRAEVAAERRARTAESQ